MTSTYHNTNPSLNWRKQSKIEEVTLFSIINNLTQSNYNNDNNDDYNDNDNDSNNDDDGNNNNNIGNE